MFGCLVRTVPIAVRALRVAVLGVPVLAVGETVPIVPVQVRVGTMTVVPAESMTPIVPALLVITMTTALVERSATHLPLGLVVRTTLVNDVRPVTPTGTMTGLAGHSPTATVVLPATMTTAHHVPTAEMTVVLRVMAAPARLVPSPVATDVDHVTVALVHLDVSLMIAAELHGVTMIVAHHVLTAEMTAVLRVMEGLVHRVVNLMIAVAARVVQDHRERAHHVASTTVLHVNVGARIAPRGHVHPATNRARAFSVTTLAPVLTVTTRGPVLTAMTARAQVVPRTVIAGNDHSRQKSKNVLMPSGLPSPVVGVA